jgi:hypothetical protein
MMDDGQQDSSVYAFGYGGGSRCGVEVDDLVIKTPREISFLRDAVCNHTISPLLVIDVFHVLLKGIYKRYQLPKGDVMMKKYRADMVTAGEAHTLTLADSKSHTLSYITTILTNRVPLLDINGTCRYNLIEGEVVLAWGDNSSGQLGCGQMELSARPIPVFSTFATARVIAVACGSAFSMALTNIGAVWTWGNNSNIIHLLSSTAAMACHMHMASIDCYCAIQRKVNWVWVIPRIVQHLN